jgi:hypothetical protein
MRGRLRLELRDRDGALVDLRVEENAVMRSGAELLASLFSGRGTGITHMGVGVSDDPETNYATTALTNPPEGDPDRLEGGTEAAIPAEAFVQATDEVNRVVRVRVRGSLPNAAAVGVVREAGLLSREGQEVRLYNRVTFAPIRKEADHELTMFWEMSFPYGDLQRLT